LGILAGGSELTGLFLILKNNPNWGGSFLTGLITTVMGTIGYNLYHSCSGEKAVITPH